MHFTFLAMGFYSSKLILRFFEFQSEYQFKIWSTFPIPTFRSETDAIQYMTPTFQTETDAINS